MSPGGWIKINDDAAWREGKASFAMIEEKNRGIVIHWLDELHEGFDRLNKKLHESNFSTICE